MVNFTDIISSAGIPVLPSGGAQYFDKVLWVSSTVGSNANSGASRQNPLASVGGSTGAWAKAANGSTGSGVGGTLVMVMKGHTESISSADYGSDLGTNKRIWTVGHGDEVDRPTLTWSTAASTLLLDTDSLVLGNMNLNLEPGAGTINVAAPLTISGNGCGLWRCKLRSGTDANNLVTVGVTVTGSDCWMEDVFIYGATAAEATTHLRLTNAARFRANKLRIDAATSAVGVGSLQFLTTASTNVEFTDFFVANRKAASTAAVSGMAGVTGWARHGLLHVLANTAGELTSAWGTKASVQFDDVRVTNDNGESGAGLLPLSA